MIHVAVVPRRPLSRWGWARHAAYRTTAPATSEALLRKDFSVLPVCGSVRPSVSQRGLRAQP
jgi:hypothetical protein